MKQIVNLPVPSPSETPQSPAAILAKRPARPETAPVLELTRDRRFARAAKAYAQTQALTSGSPRSLDIRL